jgi:hypothetical protein
MALAVGVQGNLSKDKLMALAVTFSNPLDSGRAPCNNLCKSSARCCEDNNSIK